VSQYLDHLTPERRELISAVRALVNANLPPGYQEEMAWGAITWNVPLSVYPDTYNRQAMCYVALASHKNTATLYLMATYMDPVQRKRLESGFKAAGKRLDMGKSCLHFKKLDDLPLDLLAEIIAAVPMAEYVARVEAGKRDRAFKKASERPVARTTANPARKAPGKPATPAVRKISKATSARSRGR